MRNITIVFGLVILFCQQLVAQTSIKILTEKKGVSLRGLAVPSEKVIWASGSKGSIALSVDGGNTFNWSQVQGYENRDFRAIHAWNEQEAIIVAVAAPAVILKTIDGGAHWNKVYENKDTSMFLDAIVFKNVNEGTVIGDPIEGTIFLLHTSDKGAHWRKADNSFWKSKVQDGEAFFASSNSNIVHDFQSTFLVTGGTKSRLWIDGVAMNIPIIQGANSTGANSISISPNSNHLIIAGGDFNKPNEVNTNFVKLDRYKYPNSSNKHLSPSTYFWKVDKKVSNLNGYKSSLAYLSNKSIIACGTSGVDISKNAGKTWQNISKESFHVLKIQPNTKSAFLAGSGGRIAIAKFD
jgi:photosystem II stability/assembly factor-like uncharacterized protein